MSNLNIELTQITPKNYESAQSLAVSPDQEKFVASVQKTLADAYVWKDSVFRLAYNNDCAVGYLLVFPYQSNQLNYVNIARIAIDQSFQGKGLGRSLLKKTIRWIESFDPMVDVIRISTLPHNATALKLYKSEGFIEKGIEEGEVALYHKCESKVEKMA